MNASKLFIKIALVIKTSGLEYDDRVRKEILSVKSLFPNVYFYIYAMLPLNKEIEGVTDYGIPFKSVYIPARDKYRPGQKTFIKSYQFYRTIKDDLKNFDIVWAADNSATIFPLLVKNNILLWDLHELPAEFMNKWWGKLLLKYVFRRCKVLLHANQERILYLQSIGIISHPEKHIAIRNYPNFEDEDTKYDDLFYDFVKWKEERMCVYLQGLANASRASYESVVAVLSSERLCAVVIGGFDKKAHARLEKEYGKELNKRVFFVGQVPQMKIPQYVRQCFISLIFYKNVAPNNWYCEANRFYQSIIMGLPVVVGNNPSMRDLVNTYGFGISIDDDGSDINKIIDGINGVIEHYEDYYNNILQNRKELDWKKQEPIFNVVMEKLME